MDVSFIIPVYNHLDLTIECLRTLRETVNGVTYEVILVNDGSESETTAGLRELATAPVRLIENPGNCGYAHSNNYAALEAKGEILFLLNNDLALLPGWFEPMYAAFKKFPKLGLCGNIQLNASTGEIDHAGAYVALDTTICHKKKTSKSPFGIRAYSRTQLITFACCAIPRSVYLETGGLDEAFVNGGEDMDLCFRLRKLRHEILVANKSVVKHHVSATRSGANINTERNSRFLQRRWHSAIANQAASRWPDHYLANLRESNAWRTIDRKKLVAALSRFLMLKSGPAPIALNPVYCQLERKERHWRALIDEWSDEMIRSEERKKHASPLSDSYEFKGLHSNAQRSGVWIREQAQLILPRGTLISDLAISGRIYPANVANPWEKGELGLAVSINGSDTRNFFPLGNGDFSLSLEDPPVSASDKAEITLSLLGVGKSNALAYLGRICAKNSLIPKRLRNWLGSYRPQNINKRLCVESLKINGEDVFNFALDPTNPLNTDYALRHANLGINLVGWFKAQLGIGESARLAAKAIKATDLPYAIVPLKVNCLASQGDDSLDLEFVDANPHPINIFHIDAPQSGDIDHHHGANFRKGKRNIAYWAWELPDFPDRWIKYFKYFDEIWTPSNFVRDAIAIKSPIPVVTIPHCIDFQIPDRDYRKELELPDDKFLFSFAYDLNSYQERKNPKGIIEAYRRAFAGNEHANDVGLVIKIHSTANNRSHYQELLELLRDVPNFYLVDRTLSREDTYGLMQASDCYVSLHRAEGFGLTVAESMFLEKPVISTNWSATTEFVNSQNGCPVAFKLEKLQRDFGPYEKGQVWAAPDPDDAAKHMVWMVENPDKAKDLGKRARQTIIELYSPHRIGDLYRKRLRALALW